MRKPAQL